ncbi:MAG: arachidonate 15-lipoxygenase [Alteromonadaceae bacterium]|jgi:arachidonate 15-lipoxygenase
MFELDEDPKISPTLPQDDSIKEADERAFDLSIARTQYNYMRTYIEGVPISASVPKEEEFSTPYKLQVVETVVPIITNLGDVVMKLWEKEIKDNFKDDDDNKEKADDDDKKGFFGNMFDSVKEKVTDVIEDVTDVFEDLEETAKDLKKIVSGLHQVIEETKEDGPTALLKSTMFYTLSDSCGGSYLEPNNIKAYEELFDSLKLPQMLTIENEGWMVGDEKPCMQDWYLGHLQIAGFNTTLIQGVRMDRSEAKSAAVLSELLAKFPVTDKIFQDVLGDATITLEQAAKNKQLFVVDYIMLDGAKTNIVHNRQRYIAGAMTLYYWNPEPPKGYPPGEGVLQPIAIQLNQKFDSETNPIYTPNNCSDANDADLYKWKVAKFVVNALCAIQHESVAHLGSCHLTVDPMVVSANRQLSALHPLLRLFKPHFRFTIQINNSAIGSLIIPRGVVATNVGPAIESTLKIIANARNAWDFDDNNPERLFKDRGVDTDAIPSFAFRDDTMLLWDSVKSFVGNYLGFYYKTNDAIVNDNELQAWVSEMVKPAYAGFTGMNGLIKTDDPNAPAKIDNLDYLIEVVSQAIYIAGPRHASVNFAQYPLMSYMPGVAGTIYAPMPTRSDVLTSQKDMMKWYPPLDIGLYTFSFEYLLSEVQFDTFGHYPDGTFEDPKILSYITDMQGELDKTEAIINERNKKRVIPYVYQVPSKIPNSISI